MVTFSKYLIFVICTREDFFGDFWACKDVSDFWRYDGITSVTIWGN